MAPIARTPTPMPTPSPADFPAWECEAGGVDVGVEIEIEIEEEIDVESKLDVGCNFDPWFTEDDVGLDEVLEVELDAPTVAARKKRLSIAQHASELRSPQHQ